MAQKRPQRAFFVGQTPRSPSRACRRRPRLEPGPTPTADPCGSFCSLRSQRSRHARTFRPCGAQAPRYRDRQSASSTPTRSSLRSLCGPAISRSLWPGRWAACGGLSANTSGEYPSGEYVAGWLPQTRQSHDRKGRGHRDRALYSDSASGPLQSWLLAMLIHKSNKVRTIVWPVRIQLSKTGKGFQAS